MDLIKTNLSSTDHHARTGSMTVRGKQIRLPAFFPVGTLGTVKSLSPKDLHEAGVEGILANTYHLLLRPGPATIAELGGVHRFMGWDGLVLTDSGGYQVFSHAPRVTVDEDGATFRSHLDGQQIHLSPEGALDIQAQLDSDIAMVLDEVIALPETRDRVEAAADRTLRWARRSADYHRANSQKGQALFAIVQGATDLNLRRQQVEALSEMDFAGYAMGGLAVGESRDELHATMEATIHLLPADRPRYVMGIGYPEDLLAGIASGADFFDCVVPTRHARTGQAFTSHGVVRLRNHEHRSSDAPLDPECKCETCSTFTRSYLSHLYRSNEMLGPILIARHNVFFYQALMAGARDAITDSRFSTFRGEFLERYGSST